MHLFHKGGFDSLLQKQPPRGGNKIFFTNNFHKIHRKAPMTEYFFTKHYTRNKVFHKGIIQ